MPRTRAALASCAVARIAWPMRLFFMKTMTATARMTAKTKPTMRVEAIVISPSANDSVGRSAFADCVSGPNARLMLCWMTIAMPNVASSEVKRSRVMTLQMTVW